MQGGRDALLFDLLESSGLASWVSVRAPAVATKVHLQRFHSSAYVDALEAADPMEHAAGLDRRASYAGGDDGDVDGGGGDDDGGDEPRHRKRPRAGSILSAAALDDFGLVDDCAPFRGVFQYACAVAGASLQVA